MKSADTCRAVQHTQDVDMRRFSDSFQQLAKQKQEKKYNIRAGLMAGLCSTGTEELKKWILIIGPLSHILLLSHKPGRPL